MSATRRALKKNYSRRFELELVAMNEENKGRELLCGGGEEDRRSMIREENEGARRLVARYGLSTMRGCLP